MAAAENFSHFPSSNELSQFSRIGINVLRDGTEERPEEEEEEEVGKDDHPIRIDPTWPTSHSSRPDCVPTVWSSLLFLCHRLIQSVVSCDSLGSKIRSGEEFVDLIHRFKDSDVNCISVSDMVLCGQQPTI